MQRVNLFYCYKGFCYWMPFISKKLGWFLIMAISALTLGCIDILVSILANLMLILPIPEWDSFGREEYHWGVWLVLKNLVIKENEKTDQYCIYCLLMIVIFFNYIFYYILYFYILFTVIQKLDVSYVLDLH